MIRSYRRTLAGDRRKLLERFRYVHAARKVVGVGSVGTRAWICLMLGRDGDDPLFLQFKEAQPSVLEPFLGRSEFANSGQRVVEGQRLTQAASDIMLGWIKIEGVDGVKRDFYIRQLWDAKMSALVEFMEPRAMVALRARLRRASSPAPTRAPATASRSRATSATATPSTARSRRFAESYADQNERDYAALKTAVEVGRVQRGVRPVEAIGPVRRRSRMTHGPSDPLGLRRCRSAPCPRRGRRRMRAPRRRLRLERRRSSDTTPTTEWADGLCSAITTWTVVDHVDRSTR